MTVMPITKAAAAAAAQAPSTTPTLQPSGIYIEIHCTLQVCTMSCVSYQTKASLCGSVGADFVNHACGHEFKFRRK